MTDYTEEPLVLAQAVLDFTVESWRRRIPGLDRAIAQMLTIYGREREQQGRRAGLIRAKEILWTGSGCLPEEAYQHMNAATRRMDEEESAS